MSQRPLAELYERVTGKRIGLMADVVDSSISFTVMLSGPFGRIDELICRNVTQDVNYNVYPGGETPLAVAGDRITIPITVTNTGTAGDIFFRLKDADTNEILDEFTLPFKANETRTTFFGAIGCELYMPNRNWNLLVEVGH